MRWLAVVLLILSASFRALAPAAEQVVFGVGEGPCPPHGSAQPVRILATTVDGKTHSLQLSTPLRSLKGNARTGYHFRTNEDKPIEIAYGQFKSLIPVCEWEEHWQRHAVGNVTFKRVPNDLPVDVYLPPGLRLATRPEHLGVKQYFYTVAGVVLKSGDPQAIVEIIAERAGPDGAVAAGDITVLDQPVAHIASVRNDQPTRVVMPNP